MTSKKVKKIVKKKPVKKQVVKKKPAKKKVIIKKEKKLGKITHYFDKIKVAAIKLSDSLRVGDSIRVEGGESTDFRQKVLSMELKGEKIKMAKKGQQIGIKIKEKVREGYIVFKL